MVIKYKASNLIEDFNLNAKSALAELTELLGTEVKKSTVFTEDQCNIAFEHYTKQAKTEDFANYLNKKAEQPKPQAKKEEPKADKKPAAKAEKPAQKAEKQQPKADKKPAQPAPAKKENKNEPLKRADGTIVQAKQPKQKTEKPQETVKQEYVTVTVDTRQTNVNMDKFNEKYDELAKTKSFSGSNRKNANMGGKQKFGKNGKNQKQNPFAKKKQETEAERLERMHLEKARKAA